MKWKKTEIDKAINLLINGNNFAEIAQIFGRTKKSVKIKLNKLGYKYHDYSKLNNHEIKNCLECSIEFSSLISDNRKFCSKSCSAIFNNKLRKVKNFCLTCDEEIDNSLKYCSHKCQHEYHKNNIFEKIENGNIILDTRYYKKYLIEKHGNKCMECNWNKVHPVTGMVPIELEHIDGNSENNSLDNLKLLCPNCHSLTPTYKALNIGKGRHKRRERYKEGKSY